MVLVRLTSYKTFKKAPSGTNCRSQTRPLPFGKTKLHFTAEFLGWNITTEWTKLQNMRISTKQSISCKAILLERVRFLQKTKNWFLEGVVHPMSWNMSVFCGSKPICHGELGVFEKIITRNTGSICRENHKNHKKRKKETTRSRIVNFLDKTL